MSDEIINSMIELIRAGGEGAVFCWVAYLVAGLIKTGSVVLGLCWIAKNIVSLIAKSFEVVDEKA